MVGALCLHSCKNDLPKDVSFLQLLTIDQFQGLRTVEPLKKYKPHPTLAIEKGVGKMTLTNQLKNVMDGYFEKYPHMSINALAAKSGVGATTLRRILNESIKGEPAPHTVLGIVSAVTNEKSIAKLIEDFQGPVGDMLDKTFGQFVQSGGFDHEYKSDLNELIKDKICYLVYKLAANRCGVSMEEIGDELGRLGKEKASKLLKDGWVEQRDGKLHASKKNFSADVAVVAGHLPTLIQYYKVEEIEKGQNIFYTLSESLTDEGIQKIKDIQREAAKKIYDVMRSPFYEGDIPYFTVQLADTMTYGQRGEIQ